MPQHTRHISIMICKVNIAERKDGQKRYRISLPKSIGDSKKEVKGVFKYFPESETIVFDMNPPVYIP